MLAAGGYLETSASCGKPNMASKESNKRPDTMWGAAGKSYLKIGPFPPMVASWGSWREARREGRLGGEEVRSVRVAGT